MASINDLDLDRLIHDGAIRLEITGGIPTWEASPSLRHQAMVYKIQTSIKPLPDSDLGCACAHYSDVLIRFKDGSMKAGHCHLLHYACYYRRRGDDPLQLTIR